MAQDLGEIVLQIEEWIEELEETYLPDQCKYSGRTFFEFMHDRGVYRATSAKIVMEVFGIDARSLPTVEEVGVLKQAIFFYETTPYMIQDADRKKGKKLNGWEVAETTRDFWRMDNGSDE